nr:MAG TPA: hypothetical protein [Caudoviricetes sp.]
MIITYCLNKRKNKFVLKTVDRTKNVCYNIDTEQKRSTGKEVNK